MAPKKNTKVSEPVSKALKRDSKSPRAEEKANKFSKNIIKAGYQIMINTDIRVGHLKQLVI